MSVADNKSSKESKLLVSSKPNCFEVCVLTDEVVEEQPAVKPIPATAVVMTDNLNKKDADGCHTAVVGLYIQIPNNVFDLYYERHISGARQRDKTLNDDYLRINVTRN